MQCALFEIRRWGEQWMGASRREGKEMRQKEGATAVGCFEVEGRTYAGSEGQGCWQETPCEDGYSGAPTLLGAR
jgi:hypothetical protein